MKHLPRKQQLVNLQALIKQNGARNTTQFRGKHVKGRRLSVSVRVQEQYSGQIQKLLERMQVETRREILTLASRDFVQEHFQSMHATMDASAASEARRMINKLKQKWDQLFGRLAFGLSPWFSDEIERNSANASRQATAELPNLREEGKKLSIDVRTLDKRTKTILQAATAYSTDFIKSIPERYLNEVATAVYTSVAEGQGLHDLVPYFDKHDTKTKNWAHNTAMDQTRKTFNNLNLSRMKNIGITKGEWLHSGGSQHPRELHEDFDGQTFDLNVGAPVGDDGGNMVFPGEEPNCRCTFSPVVMFEDDDGALETEDAGFDPSEPRDEHGEWTSGGGSASSYSVVNAKAIALSNSAYKYAASEATKARARAEKAKANKEETASKLEEKAQKAEKNAADIHKYVEMHEANQASETARNQITKPPTYEHLEKESQKFIANLPDHEKAAIEAYQTSEYAEMNKLQYDSKFSSSLSPEDRRELSAHVNNLHNAINKSIIEHNLETTRYSDMNIEHLAGTSNVDKLVGREFINKGFSSTTMGEDNGNFYGHDKIKMNISVPKGSKALVLPDLELGERELLLQSNGRFRIDSANKRENGKITLNVTYLGNTK